MLTPLRHRLRLLRQNIRDALARHHSRRAYRAMTALGCEIAGPLNLEGLRPALANAGCIAFGARVTLRSPRLHISLSTSRGALLEIGADSYLNQGVTIHAARHVRIGRRCLIGEQVVIHDTDFHPVATGKPTRITPVNIGNNVWIGHRAIILRGVTIGDHAVVGAGAVVTRDVASRTVVAGVPARTVSTFECPDDWTRP